MEEENINQEYTIDIPSVTTVFEWEVLEKDEQERSRLWYIVMTIVALALIAYSIYTTNFLFAISIVLIVFIVIIQDYFPTKKLAFAITSKGITLDRKFYDYRSFKGFYIIYEPPQIKRLYFEFKGLRPDLSIDLQDNDPIAIRDFLLNVLTENIEKEDESLSDFFEKLLKL